MGEKLAYEEVQRKELHNLIRRFVQGEIAHLRGEILIEADKPETDQAMSPDWLMMSGRAS